MTTFFAGDELAAYDLNNPPWPLGLVAYGRRAASNGLTTATSGTTVLSIMRVDTVPLMAGRQYRISTGPLRPEMSVATDHFAVKIFYNLSGTATTSSTLLCRSEADNQNRSTMPGPAGEIQISTDTSSASFLLTVQRTSGTGTIQLNAANSDEELWMVVFDEGPKLTNTGVILN